MIFKFTAKLGEQNLPLEVKLEYRPGKQAQRARRIAVGELLSVLEVKTATIDATGSDQVQVRIGDDIWVIT